MYLCYVDESGSTGASPPETTHFVLAAISIPIWHWRDADREIRLALAPYSLEHAELHTAWMLRRYPEQADIPDFDRLDHETRRQLASRQRSTRLSRLARQRNHAQHKRNKKFFQATEPYIHLTLDERRRAVDAVARAVSRWGFARLFAECIDKTHFDADISARSLAEQAFEQIVSRFEQYLQRTPTTPRQPAGDESSPRRTSANNNAFGLLVHDHNDTVASRHTRLMRSFHDRGTLWTDSPPHNRNSAVRRQ